MNHSIRFTSSKAIVVEHTAGIEHPVVGTDDGDIAILCHFYHFLRGLLAADEDYTVYIYHLSGPDNLGIAETGKKNCLILNECEHVAHHIRAARRVDLPFRMLLSAYKSAV